jgi:hypothetical protein
MLQDFELMGGVTENIEEFLILDTLSLIQLSSCERAQSAFSSSKHGEWIASIDFDFFSL